MNIQFGENNTLKDVQFGDNNKLYTSNYLENITFSEEQWKELKKILTSGLKTDKFQGNEKAVAEEALQYINEKNVKGFFGALKRNRETFFTNILSDVASSGLISFLRDIIKNY